MTVGALALLALSAATATAQTTITHNTARLTAEEIKPGMRIVLQSTTTTSAQAYFYGSNIKVNSDACYYEHVYYVEAAETDGYYLLREEATGKYVQAPTSTGQAIEMGEKLGAAQLKIVDTDTNATDADKKLGETSDMVFGDANGENTDVYDYAHLVRMVAYVGTTPTFLNAQGTSNASKWATGNGAWSVFFIYETPVNTLASALNCSITDFSTLESLTTDQQDRISLYLQTYGGKKDCFIHYIGTGYNQYSGESSDTDSRNYTTADEKLNALTLSTLFDAEGATTCSEMTTAITTINNNKSSYTLNLPKAGDFLRIVSANTNKAYLDAENSSTQVSSKTVAQFVSTPDNAKTVFFYDGSTLENYSNGYLLADNSDFLYYNGVADGAPIAFKAATTGTTGQYNITINGKERYLHTNMANDATTSTSNAGSDITSSNTDAGYRFTLEKVDALDVAVTAAGYATFFAPVSVTLPAGLSAYTGTVNGDVLELTGVEGTIPANTAVILKGSEGTYSLPIVDNSYTTTVPTSEDITLTGALKSVVASTLTGDLFTLQKRDEGVGFYPFGTADADTADEAVEADESEETTTTTTTTDNSEIQGFKAYLTLSESTNVRGFRLDGEAVTGIGALTTTAATPADGALYDLSGRRVDTATHGIYISNGKKVIIR
jgi:hypothetical protein